MAKQTRQDLPEVDRRAIEMTKEQRLIAQIEGHKRDAAWYKKWWWPTLIVGTLGVVIRLAALSLPFRVPPIILYGGGAAAINGLYFLYKYSREMKDVKRLEAFAKQHGVQ